MNTHQRDRQYRRYMDIILIASIILFVTGLGIIITASIVQIMKEEDAQPMPTETITPNNTQDPLPEENLTGQPG